MGCFGLNGWCEVGPSNGAKKIDQAKEDNPLNCPCLIQQLIAVGTAELSKTALLEDDLKIAETALGLGSKTF